jgi:hypothetical protein
MMKCLAVVAVTFTVLIALLGCTTDPGTTLSVSLAGQPSPIDTTVGATTTLTPSIFYQGNASTLLMTFNVLQAPAGGFATITPQSTLLTVSSGAPSPTSVTVSFDEAGTYVLQCVVQEDGQIANEASPSDISASNQCTFVVLPATSN